MITDLLFACISFIGFFLWLFVFTSSRNLCIMLLSATSMLFCAASTIGNITLAFGIV